MTRRQRFIQYAYTASFEASPGCTYSVGAVVALGSRLISTGACTKKTHPKNPKIEVSTPKTELCAEVIALLRAENIISSARLKNCTLYVTRRRADGSMGMSMPCSHCFRFLKRIGVRKVFYTNQAGQIEEIKIGMGRVFNQSL